MATKDFTREIKTNLKTALMLHCEIIETLENKNETIAKIKFNPGILELILDTTNQYHLGDEVNVSGNLTIENIEPKDSKKVL